MFFHKNITEISNRIDTIQNQRTPSSIMVDSGTEGQSTPERKH
ncbi:hypothetical protein [Ehrlichia ruminantium]|nr:hypothetical protein [Ehrlichia ruminantium]